VLIEDLQTSQELTVALSGRRGDELNMVLKIDGGIARVDRLSIEEELQFASLKRHNKNLDFWLLLNDACDHAFFGYKGFEGVDYAILSQRIDSHELRLNGYAIASAGDKKRNFLGHCELCPD
jgi:hypothetical protein